MERNRKLRLGLIFGGRSGEHEVSLMSARSVLNAINPEKYTLTQIGITHEGTWFVGEGVLNAMETMDFSELSQATILPDPTRRGLYSLQTRGGSDLLELLTELDVVFPLLHGTFGEDGTLQGLLELADLAYVGAGVLGSSLAMDKGVFKDVMRARDVPVVDSLVFTSVEIEKDLDDVVARSLLLSEFPIFVKPANMGSSVGVTKCMSASDLMEGLLEAVQYDRRVLVEKGINAREIEVSVLGNENAQASIPGEIIPSREFYSYEAKYLDDASELLIPAPISEDLIIEIQELALKAYYAIDCAGMARVDFLLDKDALMEGREPRVYLNEINTIPGFTRISMYPKLWEASGISYAQLIDQLIELALQRKKQRDKIERRYRRQE